MTKSILLFRNDLRCFDNEALSEALTCKECYPVFIYDQSYTRDLGEASVLWLYHALKSLDQDLKECLSFFNGDYQEIILNLVQKHSITDVYLDRTYEHGLDIGDQELAVKLKEIKCELHIFHQRTLWDITQILKGDQTPYKVFTPFFKRGCLEEAEPERPVEKPVIDNLVKFNESEDLSEVISLSKLEWTSSIIKQWDISENGAQVLWKNFLSNGLDYYKEGRNFPNKDYVSRLSPYIRFGQISVRQLYHDVQAHGSSSNHYHFISELGWREFSYYLLYHFPTFKQDNFQSKFDKFPWKFDESLYKAWCKGKTGYPIIDAGMRELYQTGYIHNRPRMICGSFLVKNLLIHWSHGEKWFWDCLFDADFANNVAGWQWVAGTGADAAPYFRIFNPMLQGSKFDPTGEYIKTYVPELKEMPLKYLNAPWEAPVSVLQEANIVLGKDYPRPIVNFKESREVALEAFRSIKGE
ncbi:deoxyribodipyrimidine photolyase [Candidatus Marinamargulisbacteria bacterium SCGC AG-343-D04]|nr:deoxyribodipyrimidine photolyase [Candidatus Marinamargulisbacteria bacterium SCGC AG-343-D04]